jgi:hypothetical protein
MKLDHVSRIAKPKFPKFELNFSKFHGLCAAWLKTAIPYTVPLTQSQAGPALKLLADTQKKQSIK